jgi:hypothetical protein
MQAAAPHEAPRAIKSAWEEREQWQFPDCVVRGIPGPTGHPVDGLIQCDLRISPTDSYYALVRSTLAVAHLPAGRGRGRRRPARPVRSTAFHVDGFMVCGVKPLIMHGFVIRGESRREAGHQASDTLPHIISLIRKRSFHNYKCHLSTTLHTGYAVM